MTRRELAAELGVSTKSIQRHIEPAMRVGGQCRYLLSRAEAELRGVPEDGGDVIRFPVERTRGRAA